MMNTKSKPYLQALLFTLLLFSCSKKETTSPTVSTSPTISTLSSSQGSYNDQIIITGTGFSTTLANNNIFFNSNQATVVSATTTSLTTVVPLGAGTGNITVSVGGKTATGPVFTYQPTEVVVTVAGNTNIGSVNGTGSNATFSHSQGLATDAAGNIYVADTHNHLIRKITSAGIVSTLAGSGTAGSADGIGTAASFSSPTGITIDANGNLFVTELDVPRVRKITSSGTVSTITGGTIPQLTDPVTGYQLNYSTFPGIAVDANDNLFLTDQANSLIFKITSAGKISIFARSSSSSFNPVGIAIDKVGNLFVTSQNENTIYKISSSGNVSVFSNSVTGFITGTGISSRYNSPWGIATDTNGNIYIADFGNFVIKKVTSAGVLTAFAGSGNQDSLDGVSNKAAFSSVVGIATDATGNIYVTDATRIRKILFE
ncbi:MAG: virginiamycin B lyase family protein [Janthinobacterium lividum]